MKTKLFSIFDSKAECFGTPFFMPNRGMAMRVFCDLASDDKTLVSKHRDDFILYELGEFDDVTGEVEGLKPVSLGHAPSIFGGEIGDLKKSVKELNVEVLRDKFDGVTPV